MFKRITPDSIARGQLAAARVLALQHEAEAEHHAALAAMYRGRVARLADTASVKWPSSTVAVPDNLSPLPTINHD